MKVISVESDFLTYQKIFKQLLESSSKLVTWQLSPVTGKRAVVDCLIQSFRLESQNFLCHLQDSTHFDSSLPLFFYTEDKQIIFKTEIQEIKDLSISCLFPKEMKLLDSPDIEVVRKQIGSDISTFWKIKRLENGVEDHSAGYMKVKSMSQRSSRDQEFLNQEFSPTLDEEDKMFADKRESPRARPKVDKWVKLRLKSQEEVHTLKLFDLSRGGMGFITYDLDSFPKGSEVLVVGFDQFDLDDPLFGKVMSHRQVDDSQIEFKIGIKFDEGQG